VTAAIVGWGMRSIAVKQSCSPRVRSSASASDQSTISLTSAPAAKTFGPPYTITASTSRRAETSRAASRRPCWMWMDRAFIGGRSKRIVAMPSATSTQTSSVMPSS